MVENQRNNKNADQEVMEVVMEDDDAAELRSEEPIRLKPVTSVYLGRAKYSVSSVLFETDRIILLNLQQKESERRSGKYNITVPYRELDALRYCFVQRQPDMSLVVLQPIYNSYQKLAEWTQQRVANAVPENFVMIHGANTGPGGQLSSHQIERIRRWADADCEKAATESSADSFSRAVKFLSIARTFANTYLSAPNRSLRTVVLPSRSGPFNVSESQAVTTSSQFATGNSRLQGRQSTAATSGRGALPAAKSSPELINLDDDDEDEEGLDGEEDNEVSSTTNGSMTGGSSGGGRGCRTPAKSRMLDKVVLKYPPDEKNQISLYGRDLLCLRDGQYLNDNIVNFYLKHFQKSERLRESLRGKIFIYDALFATHLIKPKRRRVDKDLPKSDFKERFMVFKVATVSDTYHSTLKAWTKNVDIFTKDYLFIPFIRDQHWFLVILCNIYNLLPGRETSSGGGSNGRAVASSSSSSSGAQPRTPPEKKATIIFMDSLNKHSTLDCSATANINALIKYLECEYREKYNCGEGSTTLINYDVIQPKVPQQTNFYDCGLFALEYIERFLNDPEGVMASLKRSASSLTKWFTPKDLKMKRSKIHQTIVNLMPPDDVKQLERELDQLQKEKGATLPPASQSFLDDDELYRDFF